MLIIVGSLIVCIAVFGGYLLEGGKLPVLLQPIELLIIFGAALGSLVTSSSMSVIKDIISQILNLLKGHAPTKADYLELLTLLFELFKLGRTNALALEPQVDNPATSDIFKKYPNILHNHHVLDFICDTFKVQISSPLAPFDLEDILDNDIKALHDEELQAPAAIARIGDAMPGLGIVAAVLGIVLTMGKLTEGKEVIGHSVAAALVGTFLGILASYGFMQPLSAKMESSLVDEGRLLQVTKVAILAFTKELNPKACVEVARRSIPHSIRPTFKELDERTSNVGKS